jgi:hypothetical protein
MNGIRISVIFLILPFMLSRCVKDDFTVPTRVTFTFSIETDQGGKYLTIDSATMMVSTIQFEGYRSNADDYFFTSMPEEPVLADLIHGTTPSPVIYDIPQGIYNHINLMLHLDSDSISSGLEMYGKYHSLKDGNIKFRYVYPFPDVLKVNPDVESDSTFVVLEAEKDYAAKIVITSQFLHPFSSSRMLEGAEITVTGNDSVIIISETNNQGIFNFLSSRLEKSTVLFFEEVLNSSQD